MWNKGFSASGVVGEDVVQLLQQQLVVRGIDLKVTALANDTVGTMETAAYTDRAAAVGLILGTGTNAAYLERTSRVPKWRGAPCEEMVINTEWGNLQMEGYRNGFDRSVDAATANPGVQTFEKMISGLCAPRAAPHRARLPATARHRPPRPAAARNRPQLLPPPATLPPATACYRLLPHPSSQALCSLCSPRAPLSGTSERSAARVSSTPPWRAASPLRPRSSCALSSPHPPPSSPPSWLLSRPTSRPPSPRRAATAPPLRRRHRADAAPPRHRHRAVTPGHAPA